MEVDNELMQSLILIATGNSNTANDGEDIAEPYDDSTPIIPAPTPEQVEMEKKLEIAYKKLKIEPPAKLAILSGRIHPELAQKVAHLLGQTVGDLKIWDFPNGETFCKLGESVRKKDVFIIQPTTWAEKDPAKGPHYPPGNTKHSASDAFTELTGVIRTIKASTVKRVIAVIPYFGWQQSDKKDQSRVAIWAKLMADELEKAGVDRVVLIDLHAEQIQGFFDSTKVGVDSLYSSYALLPFVKKFVQENEIKDLVIASPDAGGVKRAQFIAKEFQVRVAYGNKTREDNGTAEVLEVVGNVSDKDVIIWDDLINTGGTLVEFSKKLKEKGARRIFVVAPHGGFNGTATQKIHNSQDIEKVIVTDSIPMGTKDLVQNEQGEMVKTSKIVVVSIARLLAKAIHHIHEGESVSDLFVKKKKDPKMDVEMPGSA